MAGRKRPRFEARRASSLTNSDPPITGAAGVVKVKRNTTVKEGQHQAACLAAHAFIELRRKRLGLEFTVTKYAELAFDNICNIAENEGRAIEPLAICCILLAFCDCMSSGQAVPPEIMEDWRGRDMPDGTAHGLYQKVAQSYYDQAEDPSSVIAQKIREVFHQSKA